jgi:hypothetical protein
MESCHTALKEWASIVAAIGQGRQTLLVRKGGLVDPGTGFSLTAKRFVLYPTFEHQTARFLRESERPLFDEALPRRPAEDVVRIDLYGEAKGLAEVQDPAVVEQLSAFHIYDRSLIDQRFRWQPGQPLVLVLVRAWRLPQPVELPKRPAYAGCVSWVELIDAVPIEGRRPVVDDATFAATADELAHRCGDMFLPVD